MAQDIKITAVVQARNALSAQIAAGKLSTAAVSEVMTTAFGGTDASGAWDWRVAYDVMQSASVLVACDAQPSRDDLAQVMAIRGLLPTETRRSERQMQLQQFSTGLEWGLVVGRAADVGAGDVILEPSAGTGCLAGFAMRGSKALVVLNELDPLRRTLLDIGFGGITTGHDAEFIDDLLDSKITPSVVVMNPPFASSSARSGDSSIALRHVLSAAKRLAAGGRLVAIVPPSVSAGRGGPLWERLCQQVTPVLRLTLPRAAFAKMGTSVETHILIADKRVGKNVVSPCPTIAVASAQEALDVLATRLPARAALAPPSVQAQTQLASVARREPARSSRGMMLPNQTRGLTTARAPTALVPLQLKSFEVPRINDAISDIYARYAPQRLSVAGASAHPTTLVESLAMASVAPPCPRAQLCDLCLPATVVTEGRLSEAQLETVVMAETAYACDLPGRFIRDDEDRLVRSDDDLDAQSFRKGYFLGDGTGCGKGRQVAGLILAGWSAGRRKALWVSRSATLIEDAVRDWTDLGGAPTDIHALSKWAADDTITVQEGIVFVTYATLRSVAKSGETRLNQLLTWLGDDFDGVIAFDEAHAMQNAGGSTSDRGGAAPSQQGLAGLRLQNAVPRARILYVSATGATVVANLAYACRLGLWGAGEGYPFTSREAFFEAMEAGGVAAMEVVARDLKALGLYTARALSFEGVEYDILEHSLTDDQVIVYDTWAGAFRTIHQNLQAALAATGISKPDGSGEEGAGSAKAAAISAFESTKQRFFGHLLQGMKAPAVIAAIRDDIEEGWAPVVQIVSTGEALLKRRLETLGPDEELLEAMLTPREYVLGYLQSGFPVTQMQLVEQEDGSFVASAMRDDTGALITSREALALRDAAIEELLLLAPIPSALDQLIWAFGATGVAEVTGRSLRPVKDRFGRLKIERRAASANSAETQAFMSGEKDILIFSDAGGTGRSYQAAQTAKNQKRRRHYLLEPGWRADNAIQGLGRTHRAAQVSAPFFRVCTTNVHGEKRFTSTIARRLDTLGALTKGQRETASRGMFRAQDNLESPIARGCLRALFGDIVSGHEGQVSLASFEDWTGLALATKEGMILDELPPIQRFLNRILALPIEMQNVIFASFMDRIAAATERAQLAGTLDVGLEQLQGDRIMQGDAEPLRIDEATGAVTSLVPLTIETELTYLTARQVCDTWEGYAPFLNATSGKVALIASRPRHAIDEAGHLMIERRVVRPTGNSWIEEIKFERSGWEPLPVSDFAAQWDAEIAQMPRLDARQVYLLTGLILPIWRNIPGSSMRIFRATTQDGTSLLGRALTPEEAGLLRGRYVQVDDQDAASILTAVLEGGHVHDFGNGLTLAKRRVAGHDRLEVAGADKATVAWLRSCGCFTEIHQFTLRLFIPHGGDLDPLPVIRALLGQIVSEQAA